MGKHKDLSNPLVTHNEENHKLNEFEDVYEVSAIRQLTKHFSIPNLRNLEQAHQIILKTKHPSGLNLR